MEMRGRICGSGLHELLRRIILICSHKEGQILGMP